MAQPVQPGQPEQPAPTASGDSGVPRLVSATLLRLRLRAPYLATLALFARIHVTTEIPTAATDGRDIFVNEAYWMGLTAAEQEGLLVHELLHAALLHIPRRGKRDPWCWNVAADIVINGMIVAEGLTLPAGGLREARLENFTVEEVYELLQREGLRHELPWQDLLGVDEGDDGGPARPAWPAASLASHWRNAQQQAQLAGRLKGRGDTPAGIAREAQALAARLDWRAYLSRYLVRTPTDYAEWDRRFVGRGLYLEALSGESVHVAIAVDTSGSVADDVLGLFVGEVRGIIAAYPHIQCDLYYIDAALHGPFPVTERGPMVTPRGGGGTDFRPFFKHIATTCDSLSNTVLVYLTDGWGLFPESPPAFPLLWVVQAGGRDLEQFPFGETVRLLTGA